MISKGIDFCIFSWKKYCKCYYTFRTIFTVVKLVCFPITNISSVLMNEESMEWSNNLFVLLLKSLLELKAPRSAHTSLDCDSFSLKKSQSILRSIWAQSITLWRKIWIELLLQTTGSMESGMERCGVENSTSRGCKTLFILCGIKVFSRQSWTHVKLASTTKKVSVAVLLTGFHDCRITHTLLHWATLFNACGLSHTLEQIMELGFTRCQYHHCNGHLRRFVWQLSGNFFVAFR